jgi:hypothetical protein
MFNIDLLQIYYRCTAYIKVVVAMAKMDGIIELLREEIQLRTGYQKSSRIEQENVIAQVREEINMQVKSRADTVAQSEEIYKQLSEEIYKQELAINFSRHKNMSIIDGLANQISELVRLRVEEKVTARTKDYNELVATQRKINETKTKLVASLNINDKESSSILEYNIARLEADQNHLKEKYKTYEAVHEDPDIRHLETKLQRINQQIQDANAELNRKIHYKKEIEDKLFYTAAQHSHVINELQAKLASILYQHQQSQNQQIEAIAELEAHLTRLA